MIHKNVFYFLISLVLITLLSIMFYYYSTSKKKNNPIYKEDTTLKTIDAIKRQNQNFIENITYTSEDLKGNKYDIKSEKLAFIDLRLLDRVGLKYKD